MKNDLLIPTNNAIKSDVFVCECARFGYRPLSWDPYPTKFTPSLIGQALNIEPYHEHIIFDFTKDNIGYGPHGLFSEDVSKWNYVESKDCYDGQIMREAINKTEPPSIFGYSVYGFLFANCQTYIDKVKKTYEKLINYRQPIK